MAPHELHRMFGQLSPTPEQEQEGLRRLLQDERKGYPMKKFKKSALAGLAAILLFVTGAAAAAVRIDQRLIRFLGGGQPELLAAGAQAVDVTTESNGAALHVTQALMDRYSILILADFTAPEGTVLDMGDGQDGDYCGFGGLDRARPSLLDTDGEPIELNHSWSFQTRVLDDGDPLDHHLTLLLRMELSEGIQPGWEIGGLYLPAMDLVRCDPATGDIVTVYSGDWSCRFPLVWQDMGQSVPLEQEVGQLDGVPITAADIYLSPMTFQIHLERETPVPLHSDEADDGVYARWISAVNINRVTLTKKDGQTIPLTDLGGYASDQTLDHVFQLSEITDLTQIQTLTLRIGDGSVTIPLGERLAESSGSR